MARTVLINLCVVIVLFVVFIFLDVNTGRARVGVSSNTNENASVPVTPTHSDTSVSKSQEVSNKVVESKPPLFDFDPKVQYKEENVFSTLTNEVNVVLTNGVTNRLAFYSMRARYYRFEVVKLILKTDYLPAHTYAYIVRGGRVLPAFHGPEKLAFRRESKGVYVAYWMGSWNPKLGRYKAVLTYKGEAVLARKFSFIARPQVKFNRLATFFNLESNAPSQKRKIISPHYKRVPYTQGMLEWMKYGDIEGFLNLSGETTGWNNVSSKHPWEYYPNYLLNYVGKTLHQSNRMVGAYIMCFYTPEGGWKKAGYQAAKSVKYNTETSNFNIINSRFVSFKDPKRFKDIVALARDFNNRDYVNMIGFDFIRFGEKAGYENADEFVRDMNIPVPAKWNSYSLNQKILWLGIRLRYKRYRSFVERWYLWKAHKTADFIYRVRKAAGITKPMWVFTLGWDHGTHHGQDPRFFLDAGVLSDFVMLYEATPQMFEGMTKSWKKYLQPEELNYIVGNQIDAVINRSIVGRNPVEVYYYRLVTGARYAPYGARGLFIHDSLRAFWGSRRGGHSTHEWMISAFSAVSRVRYLNQEIPFSLSVPSTVEMSESNRVSIPLAVQIRPDSLSNLKSAQLKIEGIGLKYSKILDIQENSNIILRVEMNTRPAKNKFIAFRGKIKGYPVYFTFKYMDIKRKILNEKVSEVAQNTNKISPVLD